MFVFGYFYLVLATYAQTCSEDAFVIKDQTNVFLRINATNGFYACDGLNLCSSIREALLDTSAFNEIQNVQAGSGLKGGGAKKDITLSVDTDVIQARVTGVCGAGFAIRSIRKSGAVECERFLAGEITKISSGFGLTGGGTVGEIVLDVNKDLIQQRVLSGCANNSAITGINSDGTVHCSTPISDGIIDNVIAGAGLTGGGKRDSVTLSVDFGVVQARVAGSCGPGFAVRSIEPNGSVNCTSVIGGVAAIETGFGLTGRSTSNAYHLEIDSSQIQTRIIQGCQPGSAMRAVLPSGAVECQPVGSGTGKPMSYGFGLSASSVKEGEIDELSINVSQIQRRLRETCPPGHALTAIAEDGGVTCQPNFPGIVVGKGLTETSESGGDGKAHIGADFREVQARVSGTCPAGTAIRDISESGVITCEPVGSSQRGSITRVIAGQGLTGGGSEGEVVISLDSSSVQNRIQGNCQSGSAISEINPDGTVVCQTTGAVSSVSLGLGLQGGGQSTVSISVDPSQFQRRIVGGCETGHALSQIDENGNPQCVSVLGITKYPFVIGDKQLDSNYVLSVRKQGMGAIVAEHTSLDNVQGPQGFLGTEQFGVEAKYRKGDSVGPTGGLGSSNCGAQGKTVGGSFGCLGYMSAGQEFGVYTDSNAYANNYLRPVKQFSIWRAPFEFRWATADITFKDDSAFIPAPKKEQNFRATFDLLAGTSITELKLVFSCTNTAYQGTFDVILRGYDVEEGTHVDIINSADIKTRFTDTKRASFSLKPSDSDWRVDNDWRYEVIVNWRNNSPSVDKDVKIHGVKVVLSSNSCL